MKFADANSIFVNVKSIIQLLRQHFFADVKEFVLERLKQYFHLNHLSDILHKSNALWNLIRFLLARNQLNFWTWSKWAISYRLESVRAMLFSTKLWWELFHMSFLRQLCSKYFHLKVCLHYFFFKFLFFHQMIAL